MSSRRSTKSDCAQTLAQVNSLRPVFTAAGWESELIVCDNNSTDGTDPRAPLGFNIHGAPDELKRSPADTLLYAGPDVG